MFQKKTTNHWQSLPLCLSVGREEKNGSRVIYLDWEAEQNSRFVATSSVEALEYGHASYCWAVFVGNFESYSCNLWTAKQIINLINEWRKQRKREMQFHGTTQATSPDTIENPRRILFVCVACLVCHRTRILYLHLSTTVNVHGVRYNWWKKNYLIALPFAWPHRQPKWDHLHVDAARPGKRVLILNIDSNTSSTYHSLILHRFGAMSGTHNQPKLL